VLQCIGYFYCFKDRYVCFYLRELICIKIKKKSYFNFTVCKV